MEERWYYLENGTMLKVEKRHLPASQTKHDDVDPESPDSDAKAFDAFIPIPSVFMSSEATRGRELYAEYTC